MVDPLDSPALQALHTGLITTDSQSYIDLNTVTGPNSIGLVMPLIGLAGSGATGTAAQGLTIELVCKFNVSETWSKLIDLATGAYIDSIDITWDGNMAGALLVENYNNVHNPPMQTFNQLIFYQNVQLNTWYHIAYVLSQPNFQTYTSNWTVYVNGMASASLPASSNALFPMPVVRPKQYIGKSNWGDANIGAIYDVVRVWDYALTQNQVQSLANQYGLNTGTSTPSSTSSPVPPLSSTGVSSSAPSSLSSTPSNTSTTGSTGSSSSSLSSGAIAGIVIGSVVGAALICCILLFFAFSNRSQRLAAPTKKYEEVEESTAASSRAGSTAEHEAEHEVEMAEVRDNTTV
jgi:hypothetical protein